MTTESSEIFEPNPLVVVDLVQQRETGAERVVIDTSAPFESVKEAANLFGGMGFWKPASVKHEPEDGEAADMDVVNAEEEAAQLERDLITKERETLNILKELETTKTLVDELKAKMQKDSPEIKASLKEDSHYNKALGAKASGKENCGGNMINSQSKNNDLSISAPAAPGVILSELKQAKRNLTQNTIDLADIRATIDLYKRKIEKERISLEKTHLSLSCKNAKISALEDELSEIKQMQQMIKDSEVQGRSPPMDVFSKELQRLNSETEKFKKFGSAAKFEILRSLSDIEKTNSGIKTAEIRLIAAKKMKEAARASEAVALAEIKVLSKSQNTSNVANVTLTYEEYSSLISKVQEANGASADSMLGVYEANLSNTDILRKVEEVSNEVIISKEALEEALNRVEAANRGKLAVEEALRKWRSDRSQKCQSSRNAIKFKNSHPSVHRKESHILDENDSNLVDDELKPVLKPTLSIGQILSRKLLLTVEYDNGLPTEKIMAKRKISLGQMLSSKSNVEHNPVKRVAVKEKDELCAKRKKFSLGRISRVISRHSKKNKKKQSAISICHNV